MAFDPSFLLRRLDGADQSLGRIAWEAGSSRPVELVAAVPRRTLAVSLTGTTCHLDCRHCGGHYLRGMKALADLCPGDLENVDSLLISGGSDRNGAVPLAEHLDRLLALPSRLRLNLHLGIQPLEPLQPLLARPGVTVSCDLVGDRETVSEVFGLAHSPEEYLRQFKDLSAIVPTVPHLTIGLRGGKISGEVEVLCRLSQDPPTALTCLVFRPTPGTGYAQAEPPEPAQVVQLLIRASRELPPATALHLGCMRPAGAYRRRLDLLAWLAGFRSIVMPDRALVAALEGAGVPRRETPECCSLDAAGGVGHA